jgi:formate-dependent nitrite reductase membrane component NrfD
MLANVFYDIRYFLLFFAIVIGAFATAWTIIVDKVPENYDGISRISYFVMGLRRALGDNDTEELITNSKYKALAWIFWLFIVIVGNIVITNFVIAVVGSSY